MSHIRKVAIVGSGYVGASIAYALMLRELADDIVLIDVNAEHAQGEAEDIVHGISYMGVCQVRQGQYEDCENCDIIIITAGKNRKPGQKRSDLAEVNAGIMKDVISNMKPYYTDSVVLVVANPVDILTYKAAKYLGCEPSKVIGTGCILDTSRLVCQLADYVGLSINNVHAMVVGEHGDKQLALWSRVSVANSPIEEYCEMSNIPWNESVRDEIMQRVRGMGADIIAKKERTHYGIATCVCYLVDAIMNDHKIVAPVCSILQKEFAGISDVAISVPTVVGRGGVIRQLFQEWNHSEILKFQDSGQHLAETLKKL